PRLLYQVDVADRVEARAHRPQDLVDVRAVHIVVHHDGPFAVVSARHAVGGDVEHVAGVAGVALPDLDRREARGGAALVIPHAEDAGETRSLQRLPDLGRPRDSLQESGLVDWLVLGSAGQDRIV